MAMKIILVPLSGTDDDRVALRAAAGLARTFDAHVEALFVAPDPADSVLVLGDGLSTLMVDEIMRATETVWGKRAAAAREMFEAIVAETGLPVAEQPAGRPGPSIRWRETVGRREEPVVGDGRLADLIVFARVGIHHDIRYQHTIETALLLTGRPVLLAEGPAEAIGRTVAIGWNGKCEAGRALAAAMPLIERARAVHILVAPGAEVDAGEGGRLADYLGWHGIAARVTTLDAGAGVGAALIAGALKVGADLLVMGAYGHSRVREMILGGATRHVMTHGGVPVLLVH